MAKKTRLLVAILGALSFLAAAVAIAKPAKEAPDTVTIDGCQNKKPPPKLLHKKHAEDYKVDCKECHHKTEGIVPGGEMEVKKCWECHKTPDEPDTPICTTKNPKKNPFHIQCIGCHKKHRKENEGSKAPKKCKGCHVKAG